MNLPAELRDRLRLRLAGCVANTSSNGVVADDPVLDEARRCASGCCRAPVSASPSTLLCRHCGGSAVSSMTIRTIARQLRRPRGVRNHELEQEAIELRFGQRVGALPCSIGFWVAKTRNGVIELRRLSVTDRHRAAPASSRASADCTFAGVARLISSASTMLAKIGPAELNRFESARRPDGPVDRCWCPECRRASGRA